MQQILFRPAPKAQTLWRVLSKAKTSKTVREVADIADVSEVFARRLMRTWAAHGLLVRQQAMGVGRGLPPTYKMAAGAPEEPPVLTTEGELHARRGVMTATEFAATRRKLGLSCSEFGRRLGRTGFASTITRAIRRFETGDTPIDEETAAKVRALLNADQAP